MQVFYTSKTKTSSGQTASILLGKNEIAYRSKCKYFTGQNRSSLHIEMQVFYRLKTKTSSGQNASNYWSKTKISRARNASILQVKNEEL